MTSGALRIWTPSVGVTGWPVFRTITTVHRFRLEYHAQTYALRIVSGLVGRYDRGMPGSSADGPDGMHIATVAKLLGVPVPTIRSWERRHGFPAPPRTNGRHRRYGEAELEQLRALRDLVTNGHSTKDAVALVRNTARVRPDDASPAEPVVNAALALDSTRLQAELDATTQRLGVEDTIRQAILPAMRELGSRWQTGSCDVSREHLATEAVRTWLARQAFLAPPPFRPHPIVLACGPKDMHTIALHSFAVILARRGWPCRMLGAMTPTHALVSAVQPSIRGRGDQRRRRPPRRTRLLRRQRLRRTIRQKRRPRHLPRPRPRQSGTSHRIDPALVAPTQTACLSALASVGARFIGNRRSQRTGLTVVGGFLLGGWD
jgi:MerR family transcriptional regulator, light-induced transcriptional regulator